jgi:hypothetical protein
MTDEDKQIVIDWMGDISPKGLLEGTAISASSEEIQDFIEVLHVNMTELWGA